MDMKTIKQLLRQPLKTLIGIALMTLATAIVCLCVGQALAAQNTKENLDRSFSTVAIPFVQENDYGWVKISSFCLDEALLDWMEQMEAEHPEIVQGIAKHGILSAYIPELTPYNPTALYYEGPIRTERHYLFDWYQASPLYMPYSCAMLVISLEEISEPVEVLEEYECEPFRLSDGDFNNAEAFYEYFNTLRSMREHTGYAVELTGTVTQVVALQEGYRNPEGRVARLTLNIPTLEAFSQLDLVLGEQYIVYGMDYVDEHGILVDQFEGTGSLKRGQMDPFNSELLYVMTPEEVEKSNGWYVATYAGRKLTVDEYDQLNAISMTLDGPISLLQLEEIRDTDGYLQELVEKTQFTVTDPDGETLTLSEEAYTQRYEIPRFARLDGSVEDFLNSEEGTAWKAALERMEINNHAFAVIGVDRMNYLAEFSLKRSQITQGRDFTQDELENGARVCLVQEALAMENGLEIGDTVTLSLYRTDNSLPYQCFREDSKGIFNPTASFYFDTTPITETAEYTIVGFYHGENWPDVYADPYAFSANTVFVPKSSVQTPMEECNSIVFNTLVLHNGMIEEFHKLAVSAGYAGRFRYNDQDYSTIAANFHNYESLAKQMLIIGGVLYVVLLLLFLLLYPGSQKKNVRTMQSFGAGFFRRFGHVMTTSMCIVLPASLLGGWIGTLLWDRLVAALQTTAESAVTLQIEPGTLTQLAAAQLVFAFFLTVFVAIFVAAPRGMSTRR